MLTEVTPRWVSTTTVVIFTCYTLEGGSLVYGYGRAPILVLHIRVFDGCTESRETVGFTGTARRFGLGCRKIMTYNREFVGLGFISHLWSLVYRRIKV